MLKMAEAYQQMAAEAGIRINIIQNPADSYWDTVWNKRDFFTTAWSARTPAQGLSFIFLKSSQINESHWYRDDYDALIDKATRELDEAKRAELYNEAQKMITEQGGEIIRSSSRRLRRCTRPQRL